MAVHSDPFQSPAFAPCGVPVLGRRTCGWLRRPDLWEINKKNLRVYGIRYIYCSSMNGCVQDMFSHCLSMVSLVYPHLLGILNISMANHANIRVFIGSVVHHGDSNIFL